MNRPMAIGILRGFALTALFLLVAPFVNAQVPDVVGPFSPYPPQYNPYLPHPATGAPSLATQATSAGVNATASGVAQVKMPSGLKIPVPVSNTAAISKAAIGNAARIAVRALGPIGAAATAYSVYEEIKDAGVTTCPPPDFFCKRVPGAQSSAVGTNNWQSYSYNNLRYSSAEAGCSAVHDLKKTGSWVYGYRLRWVSTDSVACDFISSNGTSGPQTNFDRMTYTGGGTCPNGGTQSGGQCTGLPTDTAFTDAEFEQTLQQKMDADFNFNRRLVDSLHKDIAQRGLTPDADPINANTPVTVSAPPVTSSERTVSTTQSQRPDGSTDTTTVKETTTVTPTTTGTTQGTVKTTYPSTTTQTTTVTNNVTNNSTTTTTVVNNAPVEPTHAAADDKSPRECGTPGKPKCQIDETGTPEGKTVYQTESTKVDTAFTEMESKLTTITNPDNKDTSWGWSPTSWFSAGQCEPFDFGEMPTLNMNLAFDVCPHLQKAQELLSFMWVLSTIGVILAMVWETVNSLGA